MGQLIGIVGPSGSGKSTSIENLNPKETYIINVLGKGLPFKGSQKKYNKDSKNIFSTTKYDQIVNIIAKISESRKEIKNIVIDDLGFVMQTEFFERAKETGYNKFSEMGKHMFDIFNTARGTRDDLNIISLFHSEDIVSDYSIVSKKIKTIGKLLDDKYEPQALMTVCLYTHVESKDDGNTYHFVTNKYGIYPAKSPNGMFSETLIENDLQKVINEVNNYYN